MRYLFHVGFQIRILIERHLVVIRSQRADDKTIHTHLKHCRYN